MELLERERALAALGDARDAAARGEGRVVLVTGEPGIGKTALVTRFVRDLGRGARALVGSCDDLSIPRPLGPFRDLAGSVSPALAEALAGGTAPHEVQALLVAELGLSPPTVLVLEDVHWADEATLDSIVVLGRRIASLPAVLVLTLRPGDAPPDHPLHGVLAALPAERCLFLELEPLSEGAVAALGGGRADRVFELTGGNPFYVTELLAGRGGEELPPSAATAVVGRAARLGAESRRLVELVSVVPNRMDVALLDAVLPGWPSAAEEPERRRLLEVDPGHVRFRHELARAAVRSSLPAARRRRLHAEILAALLRVEADPAEIVHHAEAAGDEDVVAAHALVAARRAAALESNREAFSHFRRAADFAGRLPLAERARVFEELASAAYVVGRPDEAFPAVERAIGLARELGDEAAVGRCTRLLSRFHWYAGDGEAARRTGLEAVVALEALGESVELARAYSAVSQLAMLADAAEDAVEWGERALALATRLGDARTRAHALVNIGSARGLLDPDETAALLEAHAVADAAGDRHEATRALINLGYLLMSWIRPREARAYSERALGYAREHEVDALASYAATTLAWLGLRAGEWAEAERVAARELERGGTVSALLAETVLVELAVRRGDAGADARLAELAEAAERAGELQRIVPVLELEVEQALTTGAPLPVERLRRAAADLEPGRRRVCAAARLAAWAAVAGEDVAFEGAAPPPHEAMLRRDWQGAAAAFGAIGWRYDRALFLSLTDDAEALSEALSIARDLGAAPLARRATRRLRELGLPVPHGPRHSTRTHPLGLTARQAEVLELLVEGLTNAEIADRLVVSTRTAEHHVAAVLAKLGAPTRRDAARRASELGLLAPDGAAVSRRA